MNLTLTLTSETEGASIWYKSSEDSIYSLYDENDKPVYYAPAKPFTILAYATKDGLENSEVVSETYVPRGEVDLNPNPQDGE